jgi:hypothetical protein
MKSKSQAARLCYYPSIQSNPRSLRKLGKKRLRAERWRGVIGRCRRNCSAFCRSAPRGHVTRQIGRRLICCVFMPDRYLRRAPLLLHVLVLTIPFGAREYWPTMHARKGAGWACRAVLYRTWILYAVHATSFPLVRPFKRTGIARYDIWPSEVRSEASPVRMCIFITTQLA